MPSAGLKSEYGLLPVSEGEREADAWVRSASYHSPLLRFSHFVPPRRLILRSLLKLVTAPRR